MYDIFILMRRDMTDEEIIALYNDGDEGAFKDLIDRYSSPLFNFSARLADRNNATDIVQETFIKVWKNLHNFDMDRASFKTWIFIIARNTITDFLRKKKSLLFSDMENDSDDEDKPTSFSENIPDEKLLPDEALQKLQDSELLNTTLEKLPLNYRTILVLHYQEDMTFDEIGKVLDKPLNTVKSQHYRAIALLRKLLA